MGRSSEKSGFISNWLEGLEQEDPDVSERGTSSHYSLTRNSQQAESASTQKDDLSSLPSQARPPCDTLTNSKSSTCQSQDFTDEMGPRNKPTAKEKALATASPEQATKRRRLDEPATLEETTASTVSIDTTSTPLKPKPPVRSQLRLLQYARPPILLVPPGNASKISATAKELLKSLIEAQETPLPEQMLAKLQSRYPNDVFSSADKHPSNPPDMTDQDGKILEVISAVYDIATRAFVNCGDKDYWSDATRIVLNAIKEPLFGNGRASMLRPVRVSAISISPTSLMPRIDGLITFKKVDFLLIFSDDNPNVQKATDAVYRRHPAITLSQTDDAAIGKS
ncbi:hypothetical protein AJ79_08940 [Helicocarpus griseus UAMH5409]|uniref:Uncharacterized protein n=1 Tax=Helicocarpus griseus UAMH5409 TaxID=1447875 RepID=A0A2B7WP03_9EURO|nr:hypothetical protein AJ79_08940 [Helicocarpus griseus UAMH5409]